MIEVEAKLKIEEPDKFRRRCRKIARFSGKVKKIDDYYTLENLKRYPRKSLRVRHKGDIYEINFKQKISYKGGVHAKKEAEFRVSDIKNFLELIKDFGFKKWVRKEKSSEVYEINKNFHIELNFVKGLGWFTEIEYLAKENEIDKARKAVEEVMKKLGLEKSKVIKEGYTKMLWNRMKK